MFDGVDDYLQKYNAFKIWVKLVYTKKSMTLKITFKQNQINKVELILVYINKNYQ
jgi:hypothetical protein